MKKLAMTVLVAACGCDLNTTVLEGKTIAELWAIVELIRSTIF